MTDPDAIAEAVVARLRDTPADRPMYTAQSLADRLALSERTVREMLKDGSIPSIKIGALRRVKPEVVDELLARWEAES